MRVDWSGGKGWRRKVSLTQLAQITGQLGRSEEGEEWKKCRQRTLIAHHPVSTWLALSAQLAEPPLPPEPVRNLPPHPPSSQNKGHCPCFNRNSIVFITIHSEAGNPNATRSTSRHIVEVCMYEIYSSKSWLSNSSCLIIMFTPLILPDLFWVPFLFFGLSNHSMMLYHNSISIRSKKCRYI